MAKPLGTNPTMLDPGPDDFSMFDDPPFFDKVLAFRDDEEDLGEHEEVDDREFYDILGGTGKIIVDTFGYFIPPRKHEPPEFPRPSKPKDQKLTEDVRLSNVPPFEPPVPKYAMEESVEEMGEHEEKLSDFLVDRPVEPIKQIVRRYTFINSKGMSVSVINYGATVTAINVPDKDGSFADVVLGFDGMEGYQSEKNQFIGATLGRFSSIITDGKFSIGSREYYLSQNEGQHHMLGGYYGFDKVMWDAAVYKDKVIMTYVSKDNEEGYPGNLMVQMEFCLTRNNSFIIHTTATCSKPTIISIGNNIMFNLAGHGAGPDGLKQHSLIVNADRFIVTDLLTGLPTGEVQNVGATYYDLRVPRPLSKAIRKTPGNGYDQTFCLTKGLKRHCISFAARLVHPDNGRYLEVQTDQPGLLVYTCNKFPNPDPTFIEVATPEETDFKCRLGFGDDKDEQWPMRVLSKQVWERPLSVPDEEHIFAEVEELVSKSSKSVSSGFGDDTESASVLEHDGDTVREEMPPFDPEEFYRDEAESLHDEYEAEEMMGEMLIEGKFGVTYRNHAAIVLMPQEYPDSPKYKQFPSPVLQPSKVYARTTVYKFGIIPLPKKIEIARVLK
ncbi:hypothetical protein O3M35_008389 [Rhynocoris fuscipes]|uniref:Galactose mutarotase n=1 Tax=Rhynocoris fuscipes TaxID=488301 RepID=A0AAW1D643_9HEMI